MADESEQDRIRSQADKILASGVLGRSRFYTALFEFLLACGARGHSPKEVEIAAEVFNRGEEFDPSQDSMVRVYAHNLRQKLQQYYAETGEDEPEQLVIPKGEYRLTLVANDQPGVAPVAPRSAAGSVEMRQWVVVAAVVSLVVGLVLGRLSASGSDSVYSELAESPLWNQVTADDTPLTIVVGDYYIFGELDIYGNVVRMVREFDINSARDLDDRFMLEPEYSDGHIDLDLTYLPTSTAFALRDVMQVLAAAGKPVSVVATSNLNTASIRDSHVIYVGYLSGLGMLSDFVFSASELAMGETPDEIVNTRTGEVFLSEAGLPSDRGSYRDYGLFATLSGPGGNQLVIVSGTRDEGLMQTAAAVADPAMVAAAIENIGGAGDGEAVSFELLYEVAGMDRTNLSATIVHSAVLSE